MKQHRKSTRIHFVFIVGLITLFRMFLVAADEIVPADNDASNYARQSVHYLSGSPYDGFPTQQAGISLLARAGVQLGIPYKLLLDGILWGVALAAGATAFRLSGSAIYGSLMVAALLFNPWFMLNSKMFMSEPVVSPLLLLLVISAAPFLIVPTPRWSAAMVLSAVFASTVFVLIRPELPLLAGFWALLFLAVLFSQPGHGFVSRIFQRRILRLGWLGLPLVSAFCATHLMKYVHQRHYGVYALHRTEAPGLKQLMNALYSIPTTEAIRYAPVTRQSLAMACDASPTLAAYREALLNVNALNYRNARRNLGLEDEVGSWLNWHLINSFQGMRYETHQRMIVAAQEIRDAQQQGKLARRTAFFPVDPLWREWISDVPEELVSAFKSSFKTEVDPERFDEYLKDRSVRNSVLAGFFDDGLLRRHGTTAFRDLRVFGYLAAPTSNFREVRLLDEADQVIAMAPLIERLPDRFSSEQVDVSLVVPDGLHRLNESLRLEFIPRQTDSANRYVIKIRPEMNNRRFPLGDDHDPAWKEVWQISVSSVDQPNHTRMVCLEGLREHYGKLLLGAAAVAFLRGLLRHTRYRNIRGLFWLLLVGAGLLAGRCLYYVLIEVWLKWGLARYVEPNILLSVFLVLCFAYLAGNQVRRMVLKLQSHPASTPKVT